MATSWRCGGNPIGGRLTRNQSRWAVGHTPDLASGSCDLGLAVTNLRASFGVGAG